MCRVLADALMRRVYKNNLCMSRWVPASILAPHIPTDHCSRGLKTPSGMTFVEVVVASRSSRKRKLLVAVEATKLAATSQFG